MTFCRALVWGGTLPFFLFIWALNLAAGNLVASEAKPLAIKGWPLLPLDESQPPPLWLGDEPVFGRLVCPPLARLNLLQQRSEGLIISDVTVKKPSAGAGAGAGAPLQWVYSLRPGIYWWTGQSVEAEHVASFMAAELPKIAAAKSAGLWQLPAYKVSHQGLHITLSWQNPPPFGPFIFNGVPFWRAASPAAKEGQRKDEKSRYAYECAGIYRPRQGQQGTLMLPTPGYQVARTPLYLTHDKTAASQVGLAGVFDFKMAETFAVDPLVRPPDVAASCAQPLDLPYLSLITWNLERPLLQDPQLRSIFTSLTPRGALLRSAAGFAGTLQSSLIPREHPGYFEQKLLRPFDLSQSAQDLATLGYQRPQGDRLRTDLKQQPLQLRLSSLNPQWGILEKVIADNFMAVGIDLRFVRKPNPAELQKLDGVLTGVYLPWPDLNLLPQLHGQAQVAFPFWKLKDKVLDQLLEAYARSVTESRPDFKILQKIHSQLYALEPMSVLMQHKICLQTERLAIKQHIDVRDPDWFRKLVL